jgi:glycerol-3-phosphate dehydrogenase
VNNRIDVSAVKIGVVGAGSWGTALADLLGLKGYKIDLWVFEKEVKEQIQACRENKVFLPGFPLSANIFPSNDISEVVSTKDIVLIVVPSHVMREKVQQIRRHVSSSTIIVSASKGIENKTHLTMSGVLKEIRRLGLKLGANPRTFAGIAGVGDLVLTCTGDISRNRTVGKKIGEGMKVKEILSEMRMVAEGVKTAKSVYNLSRRLSVEMPISHEVYHILYDDVSPKEAAYRLMTRNLKNELDEK